MSEWNPPNPILVIRKTLAELKGEFPQSSPVRWELDAVFHAAFENQAIAIRSIVNPTEEEIRELPQYIPTMGGIPFQTNGFLPEGTAVLFDKAGHILRIIRLEKPPHV